MDEAFMALGELLPGLLPVLPDLVDEEAGVRSRVIALEVQTPVELWVDLTTDGRIEIGGSPPIYHLETSLLPAFHAMRVVAVRSEEEA